MPNIEKQIQRVKQNEDQRNMFQMRAQDNTSEKDLIEMEISNLPDREFKAMVLNILRGLRKIEEHYETSTKI